MTRFQPRGMSFVEVVIASTIFSVIIALSFSVLHFSARAFNEDVQNADLQLKGEKALRSIDDLIADSCTFSTLPVVYNGITYNDAEIRFRVPISNPSNENLPVHTGLLANNKAGWPGSTSTFKGTNPTFPGEFYQQIIYGWRDDQRTMIDAKNGRPVPLQGPGIQPATSSSSIPSDIVLGSTAQYSGGPIIPNSTPDGFMMVHFVLNPNASVGKNGIFDESVEKVDIDGDGLFNSKYAVGYMEKSYGVFNVRNANGTSNTSVPTYVVLSKINMADSNVLQPIPNPPEPSVETATTLAQAATLKTNRIFTLEYDANGQVLPVVHINIFLLSMSSEARIPRVVRCSTLNFLRNNQ